MTGGATRRFYLLTKVSQMYDTATIFADGSMRIDGFVPNKWRLLAINGTFAVFHSPGQNWSDNGGQHYGPASIEVKEIEALMPGNEPGTWRLKFKRLGRGISFHPQPTHACKDAMNELSYRGDQLMAWIAKEK